MAAPAQKIEITQAAIDHVAELARLEFNADEKKQIATDLKRIVAFVEKLEELDTEGVEPLVFMTEEINVMRSDEAVETITHQEALKNAPEKDSDYFRVPKVVNK